MPVNHSDEDIRIRRRSVVARMYLEGYNMMDIAEKVQISVGTVYADLKLIQEEWMASALRDFDQKKAIELAKIDKTEHEAWLAWERSVTRPQLKRIRVEKQLIAPPQPPPKSPTNGHARINGNGSNGTSNHKQEKARLETVKKTVEITTRESIGDPRFLEMVKRCIELRLKMAGLLREEGTKVTVTVLDWDKLHQKVPTPDPVEEKIQKELALARIAQQQMESTNVQETADQSVQGESGNTGGEVPR